MFHVHVILLCDDCLCEFVRHLSARQPKPNCNLASVSKLRYIADKLLGSCGFIELFDIQFSKCLFCFHYAICLRFSLPNKYAITIFARNDLFIVAIFIYIVTQM